MSQFSKLSHAIYECKYHIAFCPKYRYRILQGDIAENWKSQIYFLCRQIDKIEILELYIQVDRVHMVVSIAPKYSVSTFMGFLKGKLALKLFEHYYAYFGAIENSDCLEPASLSAKDSLQNTDNYARFIWCLIRKPGTVISCVTEIKQLNFHFLVPTFQKKTGLLLFN